MMTKANRNAPSSFATSNIYVVAAILASNAVRLVGIKRDALGLNEYHFAPSDEAERLSQAYGAKTLSVDAKTYVEHLSRVRDDIRKARRELQAAY